MRSLIANNSPSGTILAATNPVATQYRGFSTQGGQPYGTPTPIVGGSWSGQNNGGVIPLSSRYGVTGLRADNAAGTLELIVAEQTAIFPLGPNPPLQSMLEALVLFDPFGDPTVYRNPALTSFTAASSGNFGVATWKWTPHILVIGAGNRYCFSVIWNGQ